MLQFIRTACLLLCLLICTSGCKSILSQRGSYLRAYHEGDIFLAEENLNKIVEKKLPEGRYTQSNDASWILLDRATTHFAMGKVDEAIEDYREAIEALDFYQQDLPAEKLAQIMLQDETAAYQADDFEQILARVYFALALLHQGDESNAYAILRQAEDTQQFKKETYQKIPFTRHYRIKENGLSKMLFSLLLERRGDIANAKIMAQQAASLLQVNLNDPSQFNPKMATVLLICHNGNAPYKVSTTCPASVASAAALEILLSTTKLDPAWSTLTGIPVPALRQWPFSFPTPVFAKIDDRSKPLLPYCNIMHLAQEELEQKMPVIAARGVARLLVRRTAVGYFQKKDPLLGSLADLTVFAINRQTRADTRSWTTLPASIDLARFDLDPGTHPLEFQIGNQRFQYHLNLKPHDLCIIHIFNIHPGIIYCLIPQHFIIQKESL